METSRKESAARNRQWRQAQFWDEDGACSVTNGETSIIKSNDL